MRVVSGLAIDDRGLILMGLRRPDRLRPNLWELPGGKAESSENLLEALGREGWEELEVKIEVGSWLRSDLLSFDVDFELSLFHVRLLGEPRCLDHAELRWVDHEHAVKKLPCSPSYYVQYARVRSVVEAFKLGARP